MTAITSAPPLSMVTAVAPPPEFPPAFIVNVCSETWMLTQRTYRCPSAVLGTKDESRLRGEAVRYTVTRINAGTSAEEAGDIGKKIHTDPALNCAIDLCRDLFDYGVFVIDRDTPSEQELLDAEAKWRAYCQQKVLDADVAFQQGTPIKFIETLCFRACDFLGLQRAWNKRVEEPKNEAAFQPCPWCTREIGRGAKKCYHCHEFLAVDSETGLSVIPPDAQEVEVETKEERPARHINRGA